MVECTEMLRGEMMRFEDNGRHLWTALLKRADDIRKELGGGSKGGETMFSKDWTHWLVTREMPTWPKSWPKDQKENATNLFNEYILIYKKVNDIQKKLSGEKQIDWFEEFKDWPAIK
jgi:hypothetical protein